MSSSLYRPDERGLVVACPQCGQVNRLAYERLGSEFRCGQCKTALPSPSEPLEATSSKIFESVTRQSALPVLVDFWAPWCGPCKMMAPEFGKVAQRFAGQWLLLKVNTDAIPDLAVRFRINSIPTLVVFQEAREVRRMAGALPAQGIIQFIQQVD